MELALPVVVAIVNRLQEGQVRKIIDDIFSSESSIHILKKEGTETAQLVRNKLDQIIPGLGNPVIEVKVSVKSNYSEQLNDTLIRIESRLNLLKKYLKD